VLLFFLQGGFFLAERWLNALHQCCLDLHRHQGPLRDFLTPPLLVGV
jgi:hypothetical protein